MPRLTLLALILVCLAGCDRSSSSSAPTENRIATAGTATISGTILLKGDIPAAKPIDNSVCKHAGMIMDETVVANKDGGLANVIVYLAGVVGPLDRPPGGPVTLDQKDCRFVPHALALRAGQTLHLLNSDDEPHDVHASPSLNPAFNATMATKGATHDLVFQSADLFTVRCDVHPWMKATIGVFDSDYFAVTDADGNFKITGLPPGKYDLHAWQERFGDLEAPVTIAADGTSAPVHLQYQADGP